MNKQNNPLKTRVTVTVEYGSAWQKESRDSILEILLNVFKVQAEAGHRHTKVKLTFRK